MKNKYIIVLIIIVILVLSLFLIKKYYTKYQDQVTMIPSVMVSNQTISSPLVSISTEISPEKIENKLALPILDFKNRITKKPFGIYMKPENSPVQPEKFFGYHTGVDVEYDEVSDQVPVYAISDGVVIYKGRVDGYGGVLIIKNELNNEVVLTLYGHLNITNSPNVGSSLEKGLQIAVLGDDKSDDTAGERKHLHFGMIKGENIDYRGYVQNETELQNWYNPVDLYK